MSEDPRLQSLQRGPNGRVFQVEAHLHADSKQHIVFWDDIFEAFPGATGVLNGTVIVTRARDASLRLIDPKCIKYHPGKVLQVAGGEDMGISLGESTFIPTSVPLSKVYAQELTRKNIEQWAAMTIPEEMMITGGIYAPTICTLTTTETRPFKPLLVRTEADASSIRATSARGSDKEYEDDDNLENNQEGDQGTGDNTAGGEDNRSKDNTYIPIAISNQESMGVPATDPFASPPQAIVHNTNLVTLESPTYPQRALSDTIPSDGSTDPLNNLTLVDNMLDGMYRSDGGIIIGTLANSNGSSGGGGGGGGPISPTSLSPISMSPTSPTYPTTPPSTKPKKPGFLKSTLNRLSGRQLVSPISPTPAVETESYPVFLFPAHPAAEPVLVKSDLLFLNTEDQMMPYQPPPPSDFSPQGQDDWEWQWKDGIGWVPLKSSYSSAAPPVDYGIPEDIEGREESEEEEVVDYDALFQKIEAERARRVSERQRALGESVHKSIIDEPDTQVVPYHQPPGAVTSTGSEDS